MSTENEYTKFLENLLEEKRREVEKLVHLVASLQLLCDRLLKK